MPTPDQIRIVEDRARPLAMELWWALRPLTSVVRFMQSGAHPDDEMSGMLAALAFRDGINLSYACSTRGEGGQNDIGTETGSDLGALRTREMERACDVLGMRMYWHSETPDDPITDFGFSKSGTDTLGRWGHDRTVARFVDIVRTERPDILCPTFLDVPGQHGHHRAMTQAAQEVMSAAADPAFPSNKPPWQIKKLYLPATPGAGRSYDDDEPPPPVSLVIDGSGSDPVSGWSWDRIGQQSRAYHRTQGMGRWVPSGAGHDWKLHLAECHVAGPDNSLTDGLPRNLADLANTEHAAPITEHLMAAQTAIDAAIEHFPSLAKVTNSALAALTAVKRARSECPPGAKDELLHRLAAKEIQLGHVIRLGLGIEARARTEDIFLQPGQCTALTVEVAPGDADVAFSFDLPDGWSVADEILSIAPGTRASDPYPPVFDPACPAAPALCLEIRVAGTSFIARVPFEAPPIILPAQSASISPQATLINLAKPERTVSVAVRDVQPPGANVEIEAEPGWHIGSEMPNVSITAPEKSPEGLALFPLRIDGHEASVTRRIAHSHVAPTATARPATLRLRTLRAEVPNARVGYIGAGNDRVDHWLTMLGADVQTITDETLSSAPALASFDTIVIGIFAMRFRAGLVGAMSRLHKWTEAGGTLVTLYHRPWDNWDPDRIPPRRLEIGQPSLRWRVTDETAAVRHIAEHDVLAYPNRIGPEDWQGWVKERGLYFAKSWDTAYVPLLEMADPGEDAHQGALLVADIGKGRHVHTSLILHHQMENLVPGAFRLMANLIAPRLGR